MAPGCTRCLPQLPGMAAGTGSTCKATAVSPRVPAEGQGSPARTQDELTWRGYPCPEPEKTDREHGDGREPAGLGMAVGSWLQPRRPPRYAAYPEDKQRSVVSARDGSFPGTAPAMIYDLCFNPLQALTPQRRARPGRSTKGRAPLLPSTARPPQSPDSLPSAFRWLFGKVKPGEAWGRQGEGGQRALLVLSMHGGSR